MAKSNHDDKKSIKKVHKKAATSSESVKVVGQAGMKILNKVAALTISNPHKTAGTPVAIERKKLSVLTGIAGKSTIANALTKLKNVGWLDVTPQTVSITTAGEAAADTDAVQQALRDAPCTNEAHRTIVADSFQLKPRVREIIKVLGDGRSYTKEHVATAIACPLNSTFANMITALKKAGMVQVVGTGKDGLLTLTDDMFPFEPRVGGGGGKSD
jgi:hypothetical protein